jgi:hypothetical protein
MKSLIVAICEMFRVVGIDQFPGFMATPILPVASPPV